MLQWWVIYFILGALGSGLGRDLDDYWPSWCWKCNVIIGGFGAVIINLFVADVIKDGGFIAMALVSIGAGFTVSRLVGGLLGGRRSAKA
jgi:hypothetical protein